MESGVLLDAFSPGSRQRWGGRHLGDPAYYRQQARLLAPKAADEPHPTLMRTPAARPREEEGPGVGINAGIESGLGGGLEVAQHKGLRFRGYEERRLGACSIFAGESLH